MTAVSKGLPSRTTVARTDTDWRKLSAAFPARCSWTKSSVTLNSTNAEMIKKLVTSPVRAEIALATSSRTTRGFLKRERNCTNSDCC